MAANHGDGSGCKAHQRIEPEEMRKEDADEILAEDEDGGKQGHFRDEGAAFPDQADACRVPDAREKEHHADILHDGILFIRPDAIGIEDVIADSEEDAADYGSGDAVLAQERDLEAQENADIINGNRCCECLVDI